MTYCNLEDLIFNLFVILTKLIITFQIALIIFKIITVNDNTVSYVNDRGNCYSYSSRNSNNTSNSKINISSKGCDDKILLSQCLIYTYTQLYHSIAIILHKIDKLR